MSDDQLAKLHEFLGDPLRRRILFEVYMHDKLSFDDPISMLSWLVFAALQPAMLLVNT